MCVFAISPPHHLHLPRPSVESQISELGSIRRSLFDLEAQHERAHSHYEEEIKRIRSELLAVRQSGTVPVLHGIPGRSPRQLARDAERDLDRINDQHDAKRQKTRWNYTGWLHFKILLHFLIFLELAIFFFKVLNLLRGVQVLMLITPLGSAYLRVQHNPVSIIHHRQLLWLMNSNFNIHHQNT